MKNRIVILALCLLLIGVVVGSSQTASSQAKETYEKVKFGFVGALTGPMAMFGIAGQNGLQLWADDVKARGGINVGGKKYLVEIVSRDHKGMPAEALKVTRDLVLKEKVPVVFVFIFGNVPAAFCSEQKVLEFGCLASELDPKTPYLVNAGNQDPEFMPTVMQYLIQKLHPEIKTVAITSMDNNDGRVGRVWDQVGAEVAGAKIVYNKAFALDTLDFAPIVSAMMATKPDLLCFDRSYPQFNAPLTEQAYLQGWKGPINVNFCEVPVMMKKVPKDWLENRIVVSSPEWSDPGQGKKAIEVYKEASRRWEYVPSAISIPYDIGTLWEQGVKIAGTFNPSKVRDALLNADELQGTISTHSAKFYAKWSKQIYGISNYILAKKGPVMIVRDGRLQTEAWIDFEAWFKEHGDYLVKRLEEEGLLWSQRKK